MNKLDVNNETKQSNYETLFKNDFLMFFLIL